MKGDRLTFWLSILSVIFAGITACLSWLEPISEGQDKFVILSVLNENSYNWLVNNRISIALFSFIIILLLQIIIYYYNKDDKQKWLEEYMKLIAYKDLGGSSTDQRITIFVKRKGLRFIFPYIYRSLYHKFWFEKLTDFPNPFKSYLIPLVRFSHPDRKHSYTYFRFTDNKNDADSIVAYCFAQAEPVNIDTVYIDEIKMPRNNKCLSKAERKRIETYKKDTHMKKYKKIRLLCTKANHIYAIPIMQPEEKSNRLWGVLVFDKVNSVQDDSFSTKLNEEKIREYLDIIRISLSNIS